MCQTGILGALGYADRREVKHGVTATHHVPHELGIADVADNQLDPSRRLSRLQICDAGPG